MSRDGVCTWTDPPTTANTPPTRSTTTSSPPDAWTGIGLRSNRRGSGGECGGHDLARFALNPCQVFGSFEGLGIDLVDVLGA